MRTKAEKRRRAAALEAGRASRRRTSGVDFTTLNSNRYTWSLKTTAMSSRPWLVLSSTVTSIPSAAKQE